MNNPLNTKVKKTLAGGMIGLMAFSGVAAFAPGASAQEADELSREERRAARQEARTERRAEKVETLTSVLGLSADELQEAREAGQSIADIAAEQGVDISTVVDALVSNAQARIDAKIAAGDIDADRAAEKLDSLEERITARVNGERGEGRRGNGPAA